MASEQMALDQTAGYPMAANNPSNEPSPSKGVTEVYDKMRGFLKSTHWSKPYYSALVHNNPQLPYHLLEHVNCTYLSTPGRAPTLLSLKQHAQSLAVLISLLAPAQYGGNLEMPNDDKLNGDAPFAAQQAFDWLNDLESHYSTEDAAHKKPLNALLNLVKSNSDTEGPKWHCPLDTTGIDFPEKHPFQQHRPYECHMTLLMHANEILERLDHEYSAMGGILGIIPLDSDNVQEQRALTQAKSTLVGQWILFTQHLVVRMHELEIAYGNSLDLLANEAIVPMQHISVHGPDGRSGREIVFPQDRWILANAGEDVFSFIHQMLDRAEAYQDAQDDVFAEQKVLGDAAFSSNEDLKYRGIVKVDLNTRFYRLRKSGHGPLFVLPAFGDRPNTQHTRDMENRPTVVTVPQPSSKENVNSWESKHKDIDVKMLRLNVQNSNLHSQNSHLKTSVEMRDREIERLKQLQKKYDDKIQNTDKDISKEVVRLEEMVAYYQRQVQEGQERENVLKTDIENYKQANISSYSGNNAINPLVNKINSQQSDIRDLQKELKERDTKIEDLTRDNDTLRLFSSSGLGHAAPGNPEQVAQLKTQLSHCQQERQRLQDEVHNLKKTKNVKGKILNFNKGFKLEYGSTFEDSNLGITACSTVFFKALLEAERKKGATQQELDSCILSKHTIQSELDRCKAEVERLKFDNQELQDRANTSKPSKVINIPWKLQFTSTFRDDNQGLIVLNTEWYDYLIATERSATNNIAKVTELQDEIKSLKTPVEISLSSALNVAQNKLGSSRVYKDSASNVAVLTLDYLQELQNEQETRLIMQEQLDQTRLNAETLQEQLSAARTQLDQCLQSQNELDTELPVLQLQLSECQKQRTDLEEQINNLRTNTRSDGVTAELDLRLQLDASLQERQEKENELTDAHKRLEQVRLNERNLRVEVNSLQQQLRDSEQQQRQQQLKTSKNTGKSDAAEDDNDELKALKAELQLYKEEMETIQKLWDDLQTEHVKLQHRHENGQKECEEEKAHLKRKLDECNQSHKALQMKLAAEPGKLQPVIIELEAQRDAARQQRDEHRERIKRLETQSKKQQEDCEAEKNKLQAMIDGLTGR
ncbi:hypothetical protein GGS21DRAFT_490268 [Xylaria nigripes]|nr:hypothetical protein GGS21DRAFT_490268 [Xylaria nigripes]